MVAALFFRGLISLSHNVTRSIGFGNRLAGRMDRREHLIGSIQVQEGVEGEKFHETLDIKPSSEKFPTMETLKQAFYGVVFEETPICYVKCSKNNTKFSVVDVGGQQVFSTSCGIEGFKNCKKKTEVAGQATGIAAGIKARRRGIETVRVVVSGLGPGRMAGIRGFQQAGVNVISITDCTPLLELGPRPRKKRRV